MTNTKAAHLRRRALSELPVTQLPWLSLRDHFIATVGAHAGQGQPLGDLLVLADATFAAGSRFPLHPHKEVEILSIVLDGKLSHHGDQAHGATVATRHAQLISARDGMIHAEGNDTSSPVRMLQIWFRPRVHGGVPEYFETSFEKQGRHVIASGDGGGGMPLRAQARVEWMDIVANQKERFQVNSGRAGYLMALTTSLQVGSQTVGMGEGVIVENGFVEIQAGKTGGAILWINATL